MVLQPARCPSTGSRRQAALQALSHLRNCYLSVTAAWLNPPKRGAHPLCVLARDAPLQHHLLLSRMEGPSCAQISLPSLRRRCCRAEFREPGGLQRHFTGTELKIRCGDRQKWHSINSLAPLPVGGSGNFPEVMHKRSRARASGKNSCNIGKKKPLHLIDMHQGSAVCGNVSFKATKKA